MNQEYAHQYYIKNKEKFSQYYYTNHEVKKKYALEYSRKKMKENPEKLREYKRKLYKKLATNPNWRADTYLRVKNNLNRAYYSYKVGAIKRGYAFLITFEEFIKFKNNKCFYCGECISGVGMDRLDNNKGYEIDNIVSCCKICNFMKRDMTKIEFINRCKKIGTLH